MARESFAIGGVRVRAGTVRALELPITRLVTGADVTLPVRVVHGREDGPRIWIDAAIHGDEVVGVEVVRQVMAGLDPKTFRGTLVAVPIVNVLGFMTGDRYLPDRRDLNRSFPGSAARVAGQPDRPPVHDRDRRQVRGRASTCTPAPTAAATCRRSAPTSTTPAPASWPPPSARRSCCTPGSATARCATPPASAGRRCCSTRRASRLRFDDYAVDGRRDRRTPGAGRARHGRAGRRAPPSSRACECRASGWVRARRTGILAPRRARSARRSATASGSAPSSTPSARRCARSTPTATASSSAAPRPRWSTPATPSCTSRPERLVECGGVRLRRRRLPCRVPLARLGHRPLRRPRRHPDPAGGRRGDRPHAHRSAVQARLGTRQPAQRRGRGRRLPRRAWPTCSAATRAASSSAAAPTAADLRHLAHAGAARGRPGDEVVVTRLDHDANVRPWIQAAERAGATVRWLRFDPATAELDLSVARRAHRRAPGSSRVTAASNLLGTRPPACDRRRAGARGRRAASTSTACTTPRTPHVDVAALGADFFVCSPYKFLGPHCGVARRRPRAARDAAPRQAAALDRRGARAVRARHAALRAAGRRHRRGRLPRRRVGSGDSRRDAAGRRRPR